MPATPSTPELEATLAARDAALRDVERTMIQIVQTSISMIGFGFTIHAFLQNADAGHSISIDLDQLARRVGLALLTLGMLNLGWGMWNQLRYLPAIRRRHALAAGAPTRQGYRIQSTFVVAGLLLGIGAVAFAAMLVQALA